jgi:hypothetical protein
MNDPRITLRAERDFGDVLGATATYVRRNFRSLISSLAVIVLPLAIVGAVLQFWAGAEATQIQFILTMSPSQLVYLGLTWVIGFLLVVLLYGATWAHMRLYDLGHTPITTGAVWSETRRSIPRLAGGWLLVLLGFGVALLVALIPILGVIAYAVGAVYFVVTFSILGPVLLNEEISIVDSIRRCRTLIEGEWWTAFGVLIVLGLVAFAISMVLSFPVLIATGIGIFHGRAIEEVAYGTTVRATGAVVSLVAWIAYLVPAVGVGMLYYSLVEEHDRPGLEAKVDAHLLSSTVQS